jgi:hypothetical protein
MAKAAQPCLTIVVLMFLGLGLSLTFPAEDVMDAIYDESEAVPYEVTPLFSIVASPGSGWMARSEPSRNSLPLFDSRKKRCGLCCESNTRSLSIPNSLSLINQALPLRC